MTDEGGLDWDGTGKVASYPRYPRDFMADTRHLSLAARGAYGDLLDHQWLHGWVPSDQKTLAKLLSATPGEVRAAWAELKDKFPKDGDGKRRNRRLERERAKSKARIEKAKKGAKARHQKDEPKQGSEQGLSRAQAGSKQVPDASLSPASVSVSVSMSEETATAGDRCKKPSDARSHAPRGLKSAGELVPAALGSLHASHADFRRAEAEYRDREPASRGSPGG